MSNLANLFKSGKIRFIRFPILLRAQESCKTSPPFPNFAAPNQQEKKRKTDDKNIIRAPCV